MQDQVELFEAAEAQDKRLSRLYQYWRDKCGDRQFPDRADIDPVDFRYILGFVTLVDVIDIDLPVANTPPGGSLVGNRTSPQPGRRYYFRLDGSRLAELSGTDYTGRYLDELPWPDYVDFVRWTYDEVLRKKRPLGYRRNGNIDEHTFDEETLIFPLGAGQGRIEKLLVAVIPGEFDPAITSVIL
ncbi:MAG TPA: PAS domain-containing protein [Terriglobales bacterium]|nr:PAS domain-containing protein [Terriglobales bacterium]